MPSYTSAIAAYTNFVSNFPLIDHAQAVSGALHTVPSGPRKLHPEQNSVYIYSGDIDKFTKAGRLLFES